MAAITGLTGIVDHIRSVLADDTRSDAELIREYASSGANVALTEITRRYAPMVWGVCRRTVGHHHSAEDAFQAVFLVLARKANTIHPLSAVGGWLHGVAVHTSLRARAMNDRRRNRFRPLAPDHESPTPDVLEPMDADQLRMLDEEIAKLPEKLRTAVALCELDGLSRKDAATRLGIAEGTLSSRLAAARKQLAGRLRGRGMALGAAGFAALVGNGTAGAVPPVTATASETVTVLAEGAIRTMFLNKLKLTAVGVLALAVLATIGVTTMSPATAEERPQVRRNAPVPKVDKEGVILVGVQEEGTSRIELRTPKGETIATIPLGDTAMHHPTLSRDGKRVAVWSHDSFKPNGFNRAQDITNDGTLRVYDVDKPDEPIAKFEHKHANRILITPDGQSLYTMEQSEPYSQQAKEVTFAVYRIDLKTKKKEKLNLLAEHHLADISPDGKTLLTTMFVMTDGKFQATPHRVPLDTLKPEPLTKISIRAIQFSPDGRRFIGSKYVEPMNPGKQELAVVDLKDGKDAVVKLDGETLIVWGAAWAPDGKRLVVNRTVILGKEKAKGPLPIPVGGGKQPDGVLIQKIEVTIRNLDGSDPKSLMELKEDTRVFGVDWR